MNKALYDLEQKRKAVEQDVKALYETLQKEKTNKKDMRDFIFSHIFYVLFV